MKLSSNGKPDFIIIGAMKCATSTLHDQLAIQSKIKMSDPKEPNFFSNDEIYAKGLNWYASLFEGEESVLRGESSTHYTKLPTYPNTVKRILDAGLQDVKLIYVIRHPINRLISQYIHEWSESNIKVDINRAIELHPELIQYSNYHDQLKAYTDNFDRSNIGIVFFENLTKNTQKNLELICKFLGYDEKPIVQSDRGAKNVSSERIRKFPLYQIFVDNPVMTSLRRSLVPRSLRQRVKRSLTMTNRPEIDRALLHKLNEGFDFQLQNVGRELGITLNIANYSEVAARTFFTSIKTDV